MPNRGRRTTRADSSDEKNNTNDAESLETKKAELTLLFADLTEPMCKTCRLICKNGKLFVDHLVDNKECYLAATAGYKQYKQKAGKSLKNKHKHMLKAMKAQTKQ